MVVYCGCAFKLVTRVLQINTEKVEGTWEEIIYKAPKLAY